MRLCTYILVPFVLILNICFTKGTKADDLLVRPSRNLFGLMYSSHLEVCFLFISFCTSNGAPTYGAQHAAPAACAQKQVAVISTSALSEATANLACNECNDVIDTPHICINKPSVASLLLTCRLTVEGTLQLATAPWTPWCRRGNHKGP